MKRRAVPILMLVSLALTVPAAAWYCQGVPESRHGMTVALVAVTLTAGLGYGAYLAGAAWDRLAQRAAASAEVEGRHAALLSLLIHDVLNPLLVVRLATEMAMRLAPEPLLPHLEKTTQAVRDLGNVVQRVKDVRTAELGRWALRADPVPVNGMVAAVVGRLSPLAASRGVTVAVQADATDPTVVTDRDVLERKVVEQIVANAVKFTAPRTTVTVGVRSEARTGRVVVTVADRGPGLRPEKVGLGLIEAKTFARVLGGGVEVTNEDGATVAVTINAEPGPLRGPMNH